jgi:hypothetical protein
MECRNSRVIIGTGNELVLEQLGPAFGLHRLQSFRSRAQSMMTTAAMASTTKTATMEAATAAKASAVEAPAAKAAPAGTAARATPEGVVSTTTETTAKGAGRRV